MKMSDKGRKMYCPLMIKFMPYSTQIKLVRCRRGEPNTAPRKIKGPE